MELEREVRVRERVRDYSMAVVVKGGFAGVGGEF